MIQHKKDSTCASEQRLLRAITDSETRTDVKLRNLNTKIDTRFKAVDTRFEAVDARFDGIDRRLDGMDTRLNGIDTRLDGIDTRLDGIDKRLNGIDVRFDTFETRILNKIDERFNQQNAQLSEVVKNLAHSLDAYQTKLDNHIKQPHHGLDSGG